MRITDSDTETAGTECAASTCDEANGRADRALGLDGLRAVDEAARCRLPGDSVGAIGAVRAATTAFRESGQQLREQAAWIQLSELLLWEGQTVAAEIALGEARNVRASEANSHADLAMRLLSGDLAMAAGEISQARVIYAGVLKAAKAGRLRTLRSVTLAKVGALFYRMQQPGPAARWLQEAAAEFEALNDPRAAGVTNNAGVACGVAGEWDAAKELLDTARDPGRVHPTREIAAQAAVVNLNRVRLRYAPVGGWHWCRVSQVGQFLTVEQTASA